MTSGRNALLSIDRALDGVRGELQRVDSKMQGVTNELATARREEARLCGELARLRMEQLDGDELARNFDAADRRAAEILSERERRANDLASEIEGNTSRQTELAHEREQRSVGLDDAELALDELKVSVDQALAADAGYKTMVTETQAAVDIAAGSEEKASLAEQDRREKGKPYENDVLFNYLWKRGYGTSSYRAWLFARFMDGIVARHIRYEQARRNFYLLNEIPLRLRGHTERLQEAASAKMTALADYERAAETAAGIEALESELAAAEARRLETDEAIDAEEKRFTSLAQEREQMANGTDAYLTEAMKILAENFKIEPIPQLRLEADATSTYSDDALVRELGETREQRRSFEKHVEDQNEILTRRLHRVNELAGVRRQFKKAKYDSVHSVFDDRGNLEVMLGEFLRGTISADRVWRVIRHSQRFNRRYRAPASGGFGRIGIPRMPRGIRIPRGMGGMGGGGGFRMPGSSGGGFRTKGGF